MGSLINLVKEFERLDTSLQVVFDNGIRRVEEFEAALISATRAGGAPLGFFAPGAGQRALLARRGGKPVFDPFKPFTTATGKVVGEEIARKRRQAAGLEQGFRGPVRNTRGGLRADQRTRGEDDIINAISALSAGVLAVIGASSSTYLRSTGTMSGGGT